VEAILGAVTGSLQRPEVLVVGRYRGKELEVVWLRRTAVGEVRASAVQLQLEYEAGVAAIEVEMAKEGLPYHRPQELPGPDGK
jgi:hypothetical protein